MFHLTLLPPRPFVLGITKNKNNLEYTQKFTKQARFYSVTASILLARLYQSNNYSLIQFAKQALDLLKVTQNESLIYALFTSISEIIANPTLEQELQSELLELLISKALAQPSSPHHPLLLLDYLINRIFPLLYPPNAQALVSSSLNLNTDPNTRSIPLHYIEKINLFWFSWFQIRDLTLLHCMVDWFSMYTNALIHFLQTYGFSDFFTLVHLHFDFACRVLPMLLIIFKQEPSLLQLFKVSDGILWASHLVRKSIRSPVWVRHAIQELLKLSKSKITLTLAKGGIIKTPPFSVKVPSVDGRALPLPKQRVPPQPRTSPVKPPLTVILKDEKKMNEPEKPLFTSPSMKKVTFEQPSESKSDSLNVNSTTLSAASTLVSSTNSTTETTSSNLTDVPSFSSQPIHTTSSLHTLASSIPSIDKLSTSTTINLDLVKATEAQSITLVPPQEETSPPSIPNLTETPIKSSTTAISSPVPVVPSISNTTSVKKDEVSPTKPVPTIKDSEGSASIQATTTSAPMSMLSEKCIEILMSIKEFNSNWISELQAYWLDGIAFHEVMDLAKAIYELLLLRLPYLDPIEEPPNEDQPLSMVAHCLRFLYQCMTHPKLITSTKSHHPKSKHDSLSSGHSSKPIKWVLDTSVPYKRSSVMTMNVQSQERIQSMLVEAGFLTTLMDILDQVFDHHVLEYTCCCLQVLVQHPKNYFAAYFLPTELEKSSKVFKLLHTVRYSNNLGIQRNSRSVFHTLAKLDLVKDVALDILRGSIWEQVIHQT